MALPELGAAQGKVRWHPGFLTVLPAAFWLAAFMLAPLAILLVFSMGGRDSLGHVTPGWHPDNYLRFFTGPYLLTLFRSIGLAGATTIICLLLGFPVATWLAFQVPHKRQALLVTLITVPLSVSFLLRIYAWITILRPTGLMASAMHMAGITPPEMLYTQGAVLLGMVYNYLPFMILPLYSALEKLDRRLLEAARDLGADARATFWKVTVPLSSRGIVAGIIMVFIPSLGDYITPELMGGAKTMYIGSLVQNQYLVVHDWAFGSAVSTILLVLVAAGVWVYIKFGDTAESGH